MLGFLELKRGARPLVPQVCPHLEPQRVRVSRQAHGEPSDKRPDMCLTRAVEDLAVLLEVRATHRTPGAPAETSIAAYDRNVETAPNEEVLVVDRAEIGRQHTPALALFRRHGVVVVVVRRFEHE